MQVPESWLRSYCNPDLSSDALADALTMAGLEVEASAAAAPAFSGVVVGAIVAVAPHPNADRLRVCSVDVGASAPLQIVCGAPNAAVGLRVPCACIGAELPSSGAEALRIKPVTMRGVDSQGMLCSARELGLSDAADGLMVLADSLTPGTDLRAALDLDEVVHTIKLTPNLGHCLSLTGVARELAAVSAAPLQLAPMAPVAATIDDRLPVRVLDADLCGRFSGRVIRGVDARAPTPDWMRRRLERAGQRSISVLVDISNYLMLELGRPTHVFDLDKIDAGLEVRWGRDGEQLTLLSGHSVAVDPAVGVIASGSALESLAGIMGGEATAVSLDTRNIYVEAAFWWPDAIRGRARRYNFSTDAAARFERGVDASTTVEHLHALTRLIVDICGGQPGPVDDQVLQLPAREPVTMRVARCEQVIGIAIGADRIADIFTRLGLDFVQHDGVFTVTPPSRRFDLEIEEDLIEEVARIHGYAAIPARAPRAAMRVLPQPEGWRDLHALRRLLAARGYQETVHFSFAEAGWERDLAGNTDPIRLLNPIAAQAGVMRSSLFGGLLATLGHNVSHKARRVRLFEVGRVFARAPGKAADASGPAGVEQPMRVAALAWGPALPTGWSGPDRAVDFYDVKADLEALVAGCGRLQLVAQAHPALHPGRCAAVQLDGRAVGWIGELHPRWLQTWGLSQAPVLFEIDASALQRQQMPQPQPVPRVPGAQRDLAFVVAAGTGYARVRQVIDAAIAADPRAAVVRDVLLFDLFALPSDAPQPGLSMALRLTLQSDETLTDAQADAACAALVDAMQQQLGASLRG